MEIIWETVLAPLKPNAVSGNSENQNSTPRGIRLKRELVIWWVLRGRAAGQDQTADFGVW